MAYVVTQACIGCRYTDCVEVCPVDCFHLGPDRLAIDPDACIDCGICVPACPVHAIVHDSMPQAAAWRNDNADQALIWPSLTQHQCLRCQLEGQLCAIHKAGAAG